MGWRSIPGFDRYAVSDCGEIRGVRLGRILKPWTHKSGHLYVSLGRGNKRQVHRLVLEAFGGPAPDGMECRHLDGDPTNNHISNLQWGTRKENVDDLKRSSGKYARSTLTDATVAAIRARFTGRHGEQTEIANQMGIPLGIVNRVITGKTYGRLRA